MALLDSLVDGIIHITHYSANDRVHFRNMHLGVFKKKRNTSIVGSRGSSGTYWTCGRKSTVTDSLESDHYCTKSYFNVSVSKPSTLCRTVRNIANIDRPSFIAELSSVSEFSSVENANQFCDFLRTVMDKHAPPSLRKVITHNSSPWFRSIRDELIIAKRERRQAERKWRNTKLTIFKDLYRQAKHKVSKLVHTAKCKFYTEGIALASSSKELHQIVSTLK